MKKRLCLIVALCVTCVMSFAQNYSNDAVPHKFEASIGGRLANGDGGLMCYQAFKAGLRFNPSWSVRAGYSSGVGKNWDTNLMHKSDIVDLGVAKAIRSDSMKNFETLITLGAGYMWDKNSGTVTNKVLGMVDLESRFYTSKNSYLGVSFNAYAGKDFVQTSWLGISWGIRF